MDEKQRTAALRKLEEAENQQTIPPTENIPMDGPDRASVQAYFQLQQGTFVLEENGSVHGPQRKSTWYLASFEFLAWPMSRTAVAAVGRLAAAIWTAGGAPGRPLAPVTALILVSALGLEPRTHALKVRCSTT